jgi:predicted ATPase
LQLPSGGSQEALPRHQTLRATLDWSYALLTDPERAVFRRIAVFFGSFNVDAVESVAGGGGPTAANRGWLALHATPQQERIEVWLQAGATVAARSFGVR